MKRCVESGLWVPDANAKEHGLVEDAKPANTNAGTDDSLDLD